MILNMNDLDPAGTACCAVLSVVLARLVQNGTLDPAIIVESVEDAAQGLPENAAQIARSFLGPYKRMLSDGPSLSVIDGGKPRED